MESKQQDSEGIHARTRSRSNNGEQKAGSTANNGGTSAVSDHEASTSLSRSLLNVNTNTVSNNSEEKIEFKPRTPASEAKMTSVSNNSNNSVTRDPGRIIALEQQAKRTENRLTTLSSAVDEIKESQLHLSIEMRTSRNEILDNMRARDNQLTEFLTHQSTNFDTKYTDSMKAIADMIAASNINNNNNNSTNYNDTNPKPRTVSVNTPYTNEVEFLPITPQPTNSTIESGMELFPPSGRDRPVTPVQVAGPEPTNIKIEHTNNQQPVWYGAPSGALFPHTAGDIPVWSLDPSAKAMIAEQAKALDEYKAQAVAHAAHLRQQSIERRSPLTDNKPPAFMGASHTSSSSSTQRPINLDERKPPATTETSSSGLATTLPQPSATTDSSICNLQDQLNLIQEILISRMDASDSKEMKANVPSRNTKTNCSVPLQDDRDDKKEFYKSEVKGCQPDEIPFSLKIYQRIYAIECLNNF